MRVRMDLGAFMLTSTPFEKALKIKGYGSYKNKTSICAIEEVKTLKDNSKIKIKVINSLEEYISFIKSLNTSFENPIFYRGQTNANYLLVPNSLRINPKNEHRLIEAFSRRFSNEIDSCLNAMEKLVLMQHYGLGTRCLDISENPLAALYFACVPYKKFKKNLNEDEDKSWGEIILFQEKDVDNKKRPERLKTENSSNVSIIANTAFMEDDFSLWHLGSFWKKDANQTYNERYINLKTIVRESFIVRVPQNNPRIKNQQGAFIVVNANSAYLEGDEKQSKKLTEYILERDYITYSMMLSKSPYKNLLDKIETWNMHFSKINPYSEENEIEIFKTDPFDLKKLFYKDKKENQLVVLIPPEQKEEIVKDLARFNITEDFIYPDMDSVANEINIQINGK